MKGTLMAIAFALGCGGAAAQTIQIDFSKPAPPDSALYGYYWNIAGAGQQFTAADLKLYQEQFQRLKLVRVWGTTYAGFAQQMADEAMMVGGLVKQLGELVNGKMTDDQYAAEVEKHLAAAKDKYPFITHIEPYNELGPKSLQRPPNMTFEQIYYRGYRAYNRAVNKLNRERAYPKPLKLGACGCMWPQYKKNYIGNFLACYAADTDPGKRLDFISVHLYMDDYAAVMSFRRDVEAQLTKFGIPPTQLIMSEVGWKEQGAEKYSSDPNDALRWAMGSLAHTWQCAEQNIVPMHWVYPRKEDRHTMVSPVDQPPALTAKGNAIKLAQLLKTSRVQSTVDVDAEGCGVYSVATHDKTGVALLVWNFDSKGESVRKVTLKLTGAGALPAQSGRVTEYRLDRATANYHADRNAWRLAPADGGMKPVSAFDGQELAFNGNAAYLLILAF